MKDSNSPLARRAALWLLAFVAMASAAIAANPPTGFQETVVFSGLTNPMAVRFLPDGRVLVAEKSGLIKMFDSITDTTATVVSDLRTNVHNFWDRGMLGLAVDPDFASNGYIYVLYAHDAAIGGTAPRWGSVGGTSDGCPNPPGATSDGCTISGRLSRLQLTGTTTGPEQVLIEDWCQQYPSHSTGTLAFGADGKLYVSGGDGASFTFVDYGQAGGGAGSPTPKNPCGDPPGGVGGAMSPPTARGGALRSQSVRRPEPEPVLLGGAVLRVDPATGAAAPDNPFAADPDPNAARIVGYGLRNPFRFTIKPGTNEIFVGDVGWNIWEEINHIPNPTDPAVRNFGWPCYEGVGPHAGYDGANLDVCESLYATPGSVADPLYAYNHTAPVVVGDGCTTGSSSVAGMAFYDGGNYPAEYEGALFFSDYSRRCIWVMFPDAEGNPDPDGRMAWKSSAAGPVDLQVGTGGDIYYADFDGGTIRRYRYLGPTAVASASPLSGSAPLEVTFDGTSSQPAQEGDTISFAWDLDGDGQFDDSTDPAPVFTYTTLGTKTARLRVTDNHGLSTASAPITINVDNSAPTAGIDVPDTSLTWKVGDSIAFSGSATDLQDGPLPASALEWSVILHHCPSNCHSHVYQTFSGVASGAFPAPDHDYPSHLEIQLTATDSQGLTSVASVHVSPQVVDLTFETSPPGLQLTVGAETEVAPFMRTVIVGSQNSVAASSPQSSWVFSSWSDGGAQNHLVTAPAASTTYTASFTSPTGFPPPWVNQDVGAVGVTGIGSYANGTFTIRASGADIQGAADAFHFIHQPLSGDGTIVARVASLQYTNGWSKSGVMIRESLSAGSPNAYVATTPGHGVTFQRRLSQGGGTSATSGGAGAAPYWVKLERSGNTFTAAKSPNGVDWVEVGSATIPMATNAYIGLAATSHSNTKLGFTTLNNVSVAGGPPNSPPSVNLTAPSGGSTYAAPATIALAATASDSGGSVSQVEFYSGGTILIGTDTTSPYEASWEGVPAGTYSLTAKATDNLGAVTSSAPVSVTVNPAPNVPPSVSMTAPPEGAEFTAPASVTLKADASDTDGTVTRVDFYDGAALIGSDTSDPYSFGWLGVGAGSYSLTAVATDDSGGTTTSSPPIHIVVNPPANVPPTVSITAPGEGATFTAPASVAITVDAADSDGSVTQVEFFEGTNLLFTDTESPWTFTWTDVGAGSYSLTAKATDDDTATTTSAPVGIVVNPAGNTPPTVGLTSPAPGASFTAPATIPLAAAAGDSDGTVDHVDFYAGAVFLGDDDTEPYEFSWSGVPEGSYSLTARAVDDLGAVTTSTAVPITVSTNGFPSPFVNQDVGAVGLTGIATYASGTFTIRASGADIWGTADQFHYVYQPLSGNGTIVARVASLQFTNGWSKSGVMIRESLAANSKNAFMAITPGNGLTFQRRAATGESSVATSGGAGVAPYWVRLERVGDVFTASRSTDGVSWVVVGADTIPMAQDVFVGLAATSHSNTKRGFTTLNNVAVTPGP